MARSRPSTTSRCSVARPSGRFHRTRSSDGTILSDSTASPLTGAIVTGAGGFLGYSLARHLERRAVPLRGLDLRGSSSGHAIRCVDLSNLESTCGAVAVSVEELGGRPTMFHLAGLAHAGLCRADPSAAFTANVTATANVLEACR